MDFFEIVEKYAKKGIYIDYQVMDQLINDPGGVKRGFLPEYTYSFEARRKETEELLTYGSYDTLEEGFKDTLSQLQMRLTMRSE